MYIKQLCLAFIFLSTCIATKAQPANLAIIKTFYIKSPGGWDYLAINKNELFVSHGTQVNILNKNTGDSIGIIEHTDGVHGIAFVNALNKGYTSNGRLNNVTVFDLTTYQPITHIATGENPDAILYDDFSKQLVTCNGRSNNLTFIDPGTEKILSTIAVGGKPETAVSDNAGKLYVNIEDKNEIVEINIQSHTITRRFALGKGEGPTGLAFDDATGRLFAGCEKLLVVLDARAGKVIKEIPIGDGCDGVAYDAVNNTVLTSNGEGNLSVISNKGPKDLSVIQTLTTKPGARTITIDPGTQLVYLPTAEFEQADPNAQPGQRRRMKTGTFQVLVAGKTGKP